MLVAKKEYSYNPEPIHQPKKKKVIKTKNKRVVSKSMYFGILLIFFISSLFILNRYASITQAQYEITELQGYLRELELEKTDLEANLEGLRTSTAISEKAQLNLGMVYPGEDQLVYISVDNHIENTQEDMSLSRRIKEIFSIFSTIF